jgi:hypothetical protein
VASGAAVAPLSAIAAATFVADRIPYWTGPGAVAITPLTSFARTLIDDGTASDARTTLGLGAASQQAYAEGTWTPVVIGTTTAGTGTYSFQIGRYTRIGRICHLSCQIGITAHTGTGNLEITGLPFSGANVAGFNQAMANVINNIALGVSNAQLAAYVPPNEAVLRLRAHITGTTVAAIAMDTSFDVTISGVYEIAV